MEESSSWRHPVDLPKLLLDGPRRSSDAPIEEGARTG